MNHSVRRMLPLPAGKKAGSPRAPFLWRATPGTLAFLIVPVLLLVQASMPGASSSLHAQEEKLRVMASLTTYADIAREIGGDRAQVTAIGRGRENPHHIQPTPGLLLEVRRAQMLITTGLDLELWLPPLLDRANNPRFVSGGPGLVTVAPGIKLLDVPETLSRTEGESHIYGNHHIWTEPANGVVIARNILAGFRRVDPDNAAYYQERFDDWLDRLMRALVGDELVDLLGPRSWPAWTTPASCGASSTSRASRAALWWTGSADGWRRAFPCGAGRPFATTRRGATSPGPSGSSAPSTSNRARASRPPPDTWPRSWRWPVTAASP